MNRPAISSVVHTVGANITDENVQAELAQAIACAYPFLSDEKIAEIETILKDNALADKTKSAAIVAICNQTDNGTLGDTVPW